MAVGTVGGWLLELVVLPQTALEPGEVMRAVAAAFWSDEATGKPRRWGHLFCTDRRLILAVPRVHPLVLVLLWPVLGAIGLMNLGVIGAVLVAGGLLMLGTLPPRRVVRVQPLAKVTACTLFAAEGLRLLRDSDVVEIGFGDATCWRLCSLGRGVTRATQVIAALNKADVEVMPSRRRV